MKGEQQSFVKPAGVSGCAWTDRGESCAQPAPHSLSTTGGGPWYCRQHFGVITGVKAYDPMKKISSIAVFEKIEEMARFREARKRPAPAKRERSPGEDDW